MLEKKVVEDIQNWIKNYIDNSKAKGVVIGISGGKDSLIVAKLCINALGKENVLGIIMPNGEMRDINVAKEVCEYIDLNYFILDISSSVNEIMKNTKIVMDNLHTNLSNVTTINIPPRVRTNTLYAIAGSLNYLVANTSNLSEAMVGYTTKWGDNIGDFAPLAELTKTEVCEIGSLLNLPAHLVYKTPDDGLSGQSDEEKLGVTYAEIDSFIRTGKSNNEDKILRLAKSSKHKRQGVIKFDSKLKNYLDEQLN